MTIMKKIALIDNMNNNFFALARYLRDLNYDADLYLIPDNSTIHFHPQNDSWNNISQLDWIKKFPQNYSSFSYLPFNKRKLKKVFKDYDYIIACGEAVGLLAQSEIKIDLFIPYGSDLYHTPFIERYEKRKFNLWNIIGNFLDNRRASLQKKGIKDSAVIICNTNWKLAKNALDKLKVSACNLPRVMVYIENTIPPDSLEILSDSDFVVFSPTRHMWYSNQDKLTDFDQNGGTKRNDKLIKAFARLIKMSIYKKPMLWLCSYGPDVKQSKQLIKSLNIESNIVWLPLLDRRELMEYAKKADFIADQFRETMSATSAGTTNEALAIGTPVIANTDGAIEDQNDPYYGAPILDALTEDDILDHLLMHTKAFDAYQDLAEKGRNFFNTNLGIGLAKKYLELIELRKEI